MSGYWDPHIERMPLKNLCSLQEDRLKSITRYVYDHSAFYRQRFKEAGVEPDDMLIIRGINVFPSQVESVLMKIPEVGGLTEKGFSDKIGDLMALKKRVAKELKGMLNIAADVDLVEPGTIPRSMGKAQRLIDKRKV
jgi:phenylacetate-coenzyme A ligase PaaK-like adenylate-forming protein